MAGNYNLRSQDQGESLYATLPGTSQTGFVQHNMTAMKSNLAPGREVAGKLGRPPQHYALHSDSLCHPNQSSWPLRDNQFPWHHLVWAGSASDSETTQEKSKYYPLLAREHFVCSAPPCTFHLTLEVSEPRMPKSWIELLLDRETICEQLRIAKEEEPSRYEGATDDWAYHATLNLNTYLKNLLECVPEESRSISKRNKRFAVLFGPRCFGMFRELEFTERVELRDGVDEGSFHPSIPPPARGPFSGLCRTTEIGTSRSYLEDVRAEVQCLIHKAGQTAEPPTIITPVLHEDLGCQEVPNAPTNALVDKERYKIIGVLPNQSREAVVNAYKRQWELLPNRRRALIDSIMGIANDKDDELFSDYAITQSSVFDNQTHTQGNGDDDGLVPEALNFLGLQPHTNYSAESLIQAFRRKLTQSPADASAARSMLHIIAQNSNDDIYQANLLMEADAKMSLETSQAILELDSTDVEKSKSKDATQTYLDALEAIADHTKSPTLVQAAADLRQENGIFGPKSNSNDEDKPVNYGLPVGLHNIGNTCYLNSLLQYLFTVKPIRDIVLNYDDVKLTLTDESIKSRLLGGNKMQMDRGEAVVAQAFAKELSELFQNLNASRQTATRPSQRLANAVLLSTHTLLRNPDPPSEPLIGPKPPPLPARPSPTPPYKPSDDIEMPNITVTSVTESVETSSNSTSRTLVEEDAHSDRSYERVEKAPLHDQPDVTMDGQPNSDTAMLEADQLTQVISKSTDAHDPTVANMNGGNEDQDVDMADAAENETVDQKVLNALEHQKRSSGTDQQDVEEVMGSIINRLQAAIRPTSIDEQTGIQLERIMETFFVTTINYTKKFDEKEYQSEVSFDRAITAFPAPDGPCSLYDALGRNFDQQILEESNLSRYTAIKTLPPVLHILIQRSQSMGSKNGNAVVIPETLYPDRYMDASHDSSIFRRRVEDWALSDRITDLKAQIAKVDSNPNYTSYLENYSRGVVDAEGIKDDTITGSIVNGEAAEIIAAPEENFDFDGTVDDDFLIIAPCVSTNSELPLPMEPKSLSVRKTDAAIRQMMENELQQREKTLDEHQESMKGTPYRLHAVICHRGHLMSGHYWVWIHDFEDNTWRWYNDADVKENKNTAEVLETLSTSGEPYFLCYVRDEDKSDFVNVPKREPSAILSGLQDHASASEMAVDPTAGGTSALQEFAKTAFA
ncbi:ubiquitin-specific protease ubp2 [Conoideocrella luteorostrata]|uniref:ubiquitinyl hydrolase 1 n=1 Tax=Conoideocrella luteorostrata TaxID=1105319 RepID=A0AAJ0CLR3_9HYPO|nr:ubiquitin-specific protease ubp2 [Conoideocrella luteorostrata]